MEKKVKMKTKKNLKKNGNSCKKRSFHIQKINKVLLYISKVKK